MTIVSWYSLPLSWMWLAWHSNPILSACEVDNKPTELKELQLNVHILCTFHNCLVYQCCVKVFSNLVNIHVNMQLCRYKSPLWFINLRKNALPCQQQLSYLEPHKIHDNNIKRQFSFYFYIKGFYDQLYTTFQTFPCLLYQKY